ncbi:MAG: hypothetical protein AAGI53_11265 [Planctomycetota bacterium]
MSQDNTTGTPQDLAGIESQLEQLAQIERASMPEGLADRIVQETSGDLAARTVIGRIGFRKAAIWGSGIAAAAAVVASIPVVLSNPTPPRVAKTSNDGVVVDDGTLTESDLDAFVFVASIFDDDEWAASWSGDLDEVGENAASLDAALDDPWAEIGAWVSTESDT